MDQSWRQLTFAGVVVLLAALACNLPGRTPIAVPTPTVPLVGGETPTAQPTPGPGTPIPPSPPPAPTVTEEGGCSLEVTFVEDVTVPDDTEFLPGTPFVKTWRVRNSGTCDWEDGTVLVFSSGDQMEGPNSVPVGAAAAGSTVDISVNLTAPDEPGTYRGDWQLQTPDGVRFGTPIYVRIVVPAPTETPMPTVVVTMPAVPHPFGPIWDAMGGVSSPLGYPVGSALLDWWEADQKFEHGYMFWQDNGGYPANYIYVFYHDGGTNPNTGTWELFEDTWTEGMDEYSCPEATPPNGPKRGFGKVWCEQAGVRNGLGAPTEPEDGFNGGFQNFEGGIMLWTARLHYVYVLFDDGTWDRIPEP